MGSRDAPLLGGLVAGWSYDPAEPGLFGRLVTRNTTTAVNPVTRPPASCECDCRLRDGSGGRKLANQLDHLCDGVFHSGWTIREPFHILSLR
jgi:hypothetical protein